MDIETLELNNIKTLVRQNSEFIHPDRGFWSRGNKGLRPKGALPKPLLPNVNLIIGDNGAGKTTVLRAVAMAVLGPSFTDAKLPVQGLVRRGATGTKAADRAEAQFRASLLLHGQDGQPGGRLRSAFGLRRMGELERATYFDSGGSLWNPVFESKNATFFSVGYGATRRVEPPENLDSATRTRSTFLRGQRLQGLFTESFTLVPLETWLPGEKRQDPERYREIGDLLNRLIKPGAFRFTGKQERGVDFLFESKGTSIPFRWLSDGYRAFIGWVSDLLYHAWYACPAEMDLVDLRGVVMVDDIDLQLHPRWQMKVVKAVADAFPRIQFIFTTHKPAGGQQCRVDEHPDAEASDRRQPDAGKATSGEHSRARRRPGSGFGFLRALHDPGGGQGQAVGCLDLQGGTRR